MYYDTMRLNSEVNGVDLAEYIGIPIVRHGRYATAPCISGLHAEHKHDNNIVFDNGCHCFSCGEHYSNIGMVMQWLNVPFPEACSVIAQFSGDEDAYEKDAPVMPFTASELSTIGLCGYSACLAAYRADPVRFYGIVSEHAASAKAHIETIMNAYGGGSWFEYNLRKELLSRELTAENVLGKCR